MESPKTKIRALLKKVGMLSENPYNLRKQFSYSIKINSILSKLMRDSFLWNVSDNIDLPQGELYNIWHQIPGAHKWHHYFPIYEKIFSFLQSGPIKILEIGVYKGASVRMWKEYFHEDSLLVGVDINEMCKEHANPNRNVHIRIGSQQDEVFLKNIIQEFGKFDLIIDDGSHVVSHMIDSFNYLFDEGLKDEGIYFVEDTHSNYWITHRDRVYSFVDFSKDLVDLMHYHYTIGQSEPEFRLGSKSRVRSFSVPKFTSIINEIRFFDSIVVFYKKNRQVPVSEHL
ncbi:class I SAM-dependent methyltransferase [Hymenobacter weizhouensis]|uniref:class I SAM-dependent methyltransferase n=1 Tax=Hymenobacter sp. YIM 151500-1 TaxID=2987689 RepID=UPI002226BD05|nr:class I SAM-dependent methyltransferase [Hymenobacter sp. YIM 151500-1]UYZ61373.1 class I SAM-dependent methyltransferase [Hymenobacter sp. YIM 151500-1]